MADLTTHTIRATTNVVLCIAGSLIAIGITVAQFAIGHEVTGLKVAAVVVLVIYLLWLLFWSPSVNLSPERLGVRNLFRHYDIRWDAVSDLPLGLTLRAAVGRRKITLLAIPGRSNSGRSYGRGAAYGRAAIGTLEAAYDVRRYWRLVKAEKPAATVLHDDAPVVVRWLVPEIVILVVLVLEAILVPTLVR